MLFKYRKNRKSFFDYFLRYFFFLNLFKRLSKHSSNSSKQPYSFPQESIDKPSGKGKYTGFEPYNLDKIELRRHDLMIGNPGSGLSQSSFNDISVKLGQSGEVNFAKALQKLHVLDKLLSFWSVHNLGLNDEKLEADVDCILVSFSTIWLIDLKFYASGDVTYKSDDWNLYTIDNKTGFQVREPKKMTRNMFYAEQSFKKKFENLLKYFNVETRVVFMPTNNGAGKIDNVFWPGGIKAVTLETMLDTLLAEPNFQDTIGGQKIKQTLNLLVKR